MESFDVTLQSPRILALLQIFFPRICAPLPYSVIEVMIWQRSGVIVVNFSNKLSRIFYTN